MQREFVSLEISQISSLSKSGPIFFILFYFIFGAYSRCSSQYYWSLNFVKKRYELSGFFTNQLKVWYISEDGFYVSSGMRYASELTNGVRNIPLLSRLICHWILVGAATAGWHLIITTELSVKAIFVVSGQQAAPTGAVPPYTGRLLINKDHNAEYCYVI